MAITLSILLEPNLDISAFNSIIDKLKTVGIKVDPATAASFKQITNETLGTKEAVNQLEQATKRTGKAAEETQKAFQFNQIREGIVNAASALTTLSQPAIALDTATAQMKTLGKEAAEMAPELRNAALVMSTDLPFSAAEFQTTMFDAMASGVKGGKDGLKSFAEESAKLAVGGASTISDATKLIAGNLNAYGESAEKAGEFSDKFFNTVNYGVTSVPELNASLSNVIPTASAFGVELENVGASLAVMTSKGVPTAQATTKLNQLLLEIAKPGAALAPILKKAGVSLESLKQDDLPVTLNKINKALKETGQTAVGAFSSSEASAAFNVLAGDLKGFQQTFEDVRDTTGSSQFAFEQMSDSVQVNLNQMKARTEAFVIAGLDKLGKGFVTVTAAASQLAPTVTSLVGLKSIIPDGLIGNAGKFAKTLLSNVIPSIAATEGASAAGATGFQLMWAAATGPIGLIIGGIAATVVGLHFLSDALHETAAEKLEDNKTEQDLLKTQQESTQAKYNNVLASQALARQYESLATNTNKTAEENSKFIDVSGKLASAFPGVIQGGKTTEEQLAALKIQTQKSGDQLVKLGSELFNLTNKLAQAQNVQLNLEVDVAKEEIENQLTDAMGNILTSSAEWLTGTSTARQTGEAFSKSFTDGIYTAKTADEIAAKTAEFTAKIAVDGEKMGISKEDQLKVIKSINDFGKKRIEALKTQDENEKKLTDSKADLIAKTVSDLAKQGIPAAEAIKKISEQFKISEAAAKKAGLAGALRDAAKEGDPTKEKIAEIAKNYSVSAEEAAKVVEEQKKQKKTAEETASAVIDIAKSFTDLKKAAADALTKSQDTAAGLRVALNDLKSGTLSLEEANKKYGLTALNTDEARIQLTKKLKDERAKAAKADKENIQLGRIADSENEEKKRQEREKNANTAAVVRKRKIDSDLRIDEDYARATIFNQNELAKKLLELQRDADIKKLNEDLQAATTSAGIRAKTASAATIIADNAALKVQADARDAKKREYDQKISDLEGKLEVERYNAQKKREDERLVQDIDRANKAAEKLANADLANDETSLQRAQKLYDAKIGLLKLQTTKEIDEIISKNDSVIQAEKDFEAALLSNNQERIAGAATALAQAKALAYSSPLIKEAAEKEIAGAVAIEKERALRLEAIRIKSIESSTEREAQTALAAAKEAFDKQFKDAEKNRALELQALADFGKKKFDIAQNQMLQESALYAGLMSFKTKLLETFNDQQDETAEKELEKVKQDNSAKQEELLKNLTVGKDKYKSYTKAIIDLGRQQQEAEEKANKARFGLVGKLQKAAVATFEDMAKKYQLKTAEVQKDYVGLLFKTGATETEMAKKREELFTNVAVSAGFQLAQFAAAGSLTLQKTIKIAAKSALDLLESMIPVWSASILGVNLASSPGPVALIQWGLLTGLLTTAVEAAKAAIGNKKGDSFVTANGKYGTVDGKPATTTSDNIVRLLSHKEAVVTAAANTARGKFFVNHEIIEIANRTSQSFEEIVLSKYNLTNETRFFNVPKPSPVVAALRDDLIYFDAFDKSIKRQTAELLPVLGSISDNTYATSKEVKKQTAMLAKIPHSGNNNRQPGVAVPKPKLGGNY